MDILKINGLEKSFGDKKVLKGLCLSVPEHSIFGFVGRNGSGKTTTMKAVLGLLKTDGGEIFVAGERVTFGQSATNRHVGYLPDVPEFYPFMSAREYLRLCGEALGMKGEELSARIEELLSLVGLAGEKSRIKGYSRGMKQRLGIAQALIGRPALLICDEPTSALDPVGRKEILDILLSVKDQTTVLFSTHILSDVERICTDVALLDDGVIAVQGTAAELMGNISAEEFSIEVVEVADAKRLADEFGSARLEGRVVTLGGEEEAYKALYFMRENGIPFSKVERIGRSLESLFMEVVKK